MDAALWVRLDKVANFCLRFLDSLHIVAVRARGVHW
jgi:hypothetical protein